MLDGVSLDQLRTFIAVADEKSFSAAGRRQAGRLWISISTRGVGSDAARPTAAVAGQNTPCPVDDESIGRFAVR
jgi:hypothetical protein